MAMDEMDRRVFAFLEAIGADDGEAALGVLSGLAPGQQSGEFAVRLGMYAVGMARERYGDAWLGGFALVRMDSVFDAVDGSDDA